MKRLRAVISAIALSLPTAVVLGHAKGVAYSTVWLSQTQVKLVMITLDESLVSDVEQTKPLSADDILVLNNLKKCDARLDTHEQKPSDTATKYTFSFQCDQPLHRLEIGYQEALLVSEDHENFIDIYSGTQKTDSVLSFRDRSIKLKMTSLLPADKN